MNQHLFRAIHDNLVIDVLDQISRSQLRRGYEEGWRYGFLEPEATRAERRKEWRDEKLIYFVEDPSKLEESVLFAKAQGYLSIGFIDPANGFLIVQSLFQKGDERRIDAIFDRFYQEARAAQTLDEKYAAIARCCRSLLIFHVFPDGNGRTIFFSLFNTLLYQTGLPPVILRNPNMFNGSFTLREMVAEIKEGLAYFQKMKIKTLVAQLSGETPSDRDHPNYKYLEMYYTSLEPIVTS
jgi:hypothetical protein